MTDTLQLSALDVARSEFRKDVLDSGLLVEAGEPGLYGRAGRFDDLVEGVSRFVQTRFADLEATRFRFAPVIARAEFEQTDYIVSFPQLTGAVNGFYGTDKDHRALTQARANGEEWDSWLTPAETMLVPAVCHPLYERLRGSRESTGRVFDLEGYCFRHEPSLDPMRLQAFRMHEIVFVGTDDDARDFRNDMSKRQLAGLRELGLDAKLVVANDPFFGRTGKFLANTQLEDEAKLELVVPIYGDLDEGTAIASANKAGDHFGHLFGIETADGTVASTSCIAWGLERISLALVRTHGTDLTAWPNEVRALLSLSN